MCPHSRPDNLARALVKGGEIGSPGGSDVADQRQPLGDVSVVGDPQFDAEGELSIAPNSAQMGFQARTS